MILFAFPFKHSSWQVLNDWIEIQIIINKQSVKLYARNRGASHPIVALKSFLPWRPSMPGTCILSLFPMTPLQASLLVTDRQQRMLLVVVLRAFVSNTTYSSLAIWTIQVTDSAILVLDLGRRNGDYWPPLFFSWSLFRFRIFILLNLISPFPSQNSWWFGSSLRMIANISLGLSARRFQRKYHDPWPMTAYPRSMFPATIELCACLANC